MTGWERWSTENCARNLDLTMQTNGICTTQNSSWKMRQTSLGFWDTNGSPNLGQMIIPYYRQQKNKKLLNSGLCCFSWPQCDVVCYREMEGEVNSPTLLCLNQWALSDRSNDIWMEVSSPHSMTCILLNKERNPGHSGIETRWNSGRRKKSNDWPIDP